MNKVTIGSGNVFADIGLPQPDVAMAKARLVQQLRDLIAKRKLTQAKAAAILGLDQPKAEGVGTGSREGGRLYFGAAFQAVGHAAGV